MVELGVLTSTVLSWLSWARVCLSQLLELCEEDGSQANFSVEKEPLCFYKAALIFEFMKNSLELRQYQVICLFPPFFRLSFLGERYYLLAIMAI
jgi:hypothetical protein